jgi:hypothetical protein
MSFSNNASDHFYIPILSSTENLVVIDAVERLGCAAITFIS